MGLIISKEIVSKYRGKITFKSEYLQGSSFAFTFDLEDYETPVALKGIKNSSIDFLRNFEHLD